MDFAPYVMSSKKPGLAVIISMNTTQQGPRNYSKHDYATIFQTFLGLNFKIQKYEDLEGEKIIETLKRGR